MEPKARVVHDNEKTDEETLLQHNRLNKGEWAISEKEAVVKVFKCKHKIHALQSEMAGQLALLADIMEPQLFRDLVNQACMKPVKVQITALDAEAMGVG